jgi:hypothetical protein
MNDRIQKFEELITRPNGSMDDIFSERQRESDQIEKLMTFTPQQAYQLSKDIQDQHDSLETGIKLMRTQFSESIQQVLKDKPDPTKQVPYQNVLPYGLKDGEPNPNRGNVPVGPKVNEGLENLDPSLTKHTHSTYTKIYHRMFPDTYHELKESMFENYRNHSVKDIDGECLNHIFSSAVGSMFDWTSIDPKSVGMGSIDHLTELFEKYYFGEVDDTTARPWEEKRSDFRKYGSHQELEIQGDKFYNDFINGFFFRSCAKGYVSKETKAPKDFKSKVEGFYDFDPDLWFDNKDASGKKFKKDNDSDSYGNFFKVKQPVLLENARLAAAAAGNNPTDVRHYTGANDLQAAITALEETARTRLKNTFTGTYNIGTGANAAAGSVFLVDHKKELCCLFHSGTFRKRQYLKSNDPVNRTLVAIPTLRNEPFNFTRMDTLNFGNGADFGNNGDNVKRNSATYNEEIEPLAQLLYNTCSIGFHLTHHDGGGRRENTCLTAGAGGIEDLQVITGNGNNIVFGANAVGNIDIIQAAGGTGVVATRETPLLSHADMTSARSNATFTKGSFQFIEIKTLLKGGNKKYSVNHKTGLVKRLKPKHSRSQIKKISKAKLPTKDKKHNPVKKVIKQKGGAGDNIFDIRSTEPNGVDPPSLDASRRSLTITKRIFENYRKAIKKYVKIFGKGSAPDKIQTAILDKLNGITHFGVFYHGPDDTLNFGRDGADHPIKFEELGEMFLFSSVITNTIKLMIHFFNNIKACINNFINLDLQEIKASIDKQLKTVNTTNISSLNASYFDKYIDGCNELIKNIDKLVKFLQNNTMCLGKPKAFGATAAEILSENEQLVMNLFFGANVNHQTAVKAGPLTTATYPIEFYKFHHDLIDFFSINGNQDFKRLNSTKLQRSLRILTSNNMVLNNGYIAQDPAQRTHYPQGEYSITNVSFGGIPMTFHDNKATHYSWMTYMFLLIYREKSNEKLADEVIGEINYSLSQISNQDKSDIKKEVINKYKDIRPIIADPKIDSGSKNKILQKVFYSFFEDSNAVAKKIIEDHSAIEKKSKRTNVRGKTTITDIVQRRHLGALESSRLLIPDEIKIQQEMRKFSYKVDCLVNLLHNMLISKTRTSIKNYIVFMYAISRLRNFVYRLYYLNKTYYIENETTKKLLLLESGFDLSKNSKTPDKQKTFDLFNKLTTSQLKDQNSESEDWWKVMEQSFRDRTTEVHGKYFRLFAYVLMDGEVYLVDIFSMAKRTHSIKSVSEITKNDINVYGDDIYSLDNMFIKPITDLTKDSNYKKLLKGELHYEYTKQGSGTKKKKILEPLFIQGSTINQLNDIIHDNPYIAAAGGRPETVVLSTNPDTSFQIYKIQKHSILNTHSFRSWAYNLLFSMPTRIDVDDSYFKLHIQTPVSIIPSFAKTQVLSALKSITYLNQRDPMVEFKSKVRVNNNAKLLMNNNIRNKHMDSYVRYISREQIIMLGLVFGDSLH